MKFTIASVLLLATSGLANPVGLDKKMADLDARQSENVLEILKRKDFSKCPTKDFASCVPWFTTFNCAMPGNGVGGFPLGDKYCHMLMNEGDEPQHCKDKWAKDDTSLLAVLDERSVQHDGPLVEDELGHAVIVSSSTPKDLKTNEPGKVVATDLAKEFHKKVLLDLGQVR
ncbi:hypothetical protein FLAG1_08386 [Fusarium langsethiae]|uniref:Uncharacterized protein n=1 Tax=Fusarium langsethiae TaxID=179993 RepID=A0A0M9ESH7_FUSLA|nr:hypothetical protein FLAG1_08386 [Fusarium langsethiae]GKU12209.1 unnamed protein product [Fusarium langsethiae]GKU14360.1 unnamed protein product [Fusarium langsethiae]